MYKVNQQKGFTLMELMIVVSIIGILAAVAVPSYQNYVVRTKRGEAMAALQAAAQALERYRSNNSFNYGLAGLTACAAPCNVVFGNQVPVDGGAAYYTIDLGAVGARSLALGAAAFTLRAVPVAGSSQATDGTLTLTSAGAKTWCGNNFWPTGSATC